MSSDVILKNLSFIVVPYIPLELSTLEDYYKASQKIVRGFLHRLFLHAVDENYRPVDTEETMAGTELLYEEELQSAMVTLSSNFYILSKMWECLYDFSSARKRSSRDLLME